MNILLTGASGFLGGIICKTLEKEHKIIKLSRRDGYYTVSLDKEIPSFQHSFDIIIHSAGRAHSVPKTEADIQSFFDINVIGTENLLKGLEKSGIPKQFVFISSVAVYGQEFGILINEKHALSAQDPYGLSKIEAEKIVTDWCFKNNVICSILRLPLLVGKNPPGNLGAMIRGIKKGYYFNIGGGKAKKSMVLAEDVAKVIIKVSKVGGIYNLTDGYHPDFNELSNSIGKKFGKLKILNIPFWFAKLIAIVGDILGPGFPLNSSKLKKITSDLTFDDSKARVVFEWKPKLVLLYYEN